MAEINRKNKAFDTNTPLSFAQRHAQLPKAELFSDA